MTEEEGFDFYEVESIGKIAAIANEYRRLALLPELSDKDAERMSAILEWAMFDEALNKMIAEIDDEVANKLEGGEGNE